MPILGLFYLYQMAQTSSTVSSYTTWLYDSLPSTTAFYSLLNYANSMGELGAQALRNHIESYNHVYTHLFHIYIVVVCMFLVYCLLRFVCMTLQFLLDAIIWVILLPTTLFSLLFKQFFTLSFDSQWAPADSLNDDPPIEQSQTEQQLACRRNRVLQPQQDLKNDFAKDKIFANGRTMTRITLRIFPSDKHKTLNIISLVLPGSNVTVSSLLQLHPEYKAYRLARATTFLTLDSVLQEDDVLNLIHRQ